MPQHIEGGGGRNARRPVSRVLSRALRPTRWPFIWDARRRAPRATDPGGRFGNQPGSDLATAPAPPLLGLAPGGVCRAAPVAGCAVRSYRTLSPLLAGLAAPDERSALCGTFPGVAPAGRYPAPCFRGARTFLRRAPWGGDGGHPAVWPALTTPRRRPGQAWALPAMSALTRSRTSAVPASIAPSTRVWRKCR